MLRIPPVAFALIVSATAIIAADKDPFQELVRPTEPLTPEQERAVFHLPPGFEIQLVASEPDLRKPMNLQWDALGRLWITESREYPFAIKDGSPGRDTVRIFSDFAPDGRARKVEIFADGLNIPTGLYPFRSANADGKLTWKCVVWSIPNIWLMEDTDADGKADKRDVLFGPLGWERDTHGNLSSFRRGADGWLYGTHGFNNESTLRGRDGSELKIQSGNTWRVRLDGSRVEGWTWGQVNPFGLCWDDRGNLYSADCHSSPIYQLLRGAWYPSFGKPHDGLGFGPQTVLHSHGSTAICGPIYVSDPGWPAEFHNHMFVCNPQTSRLNHDLIDWHGASSKGKELPDFLSTDDPWFRPVDLSWGPDGALYVADFYNKIIGHYEVPLTHPGRDRERGRLWRIVPPGGLMNAALPDDAAGLVKELGSGNPTRRALALNEICDRLGKDGIAALQRTVAQPANAFQKANALWALQRIEPLDDSTLIAAIKDADPLVRTHALRIARETRKGDIPVALRPDGPPTPATGMSPLLGAIRAALEDRDAMVARCAAEALAAHAAPENFAPLLGLLRRAPEQDDHLIHAVRIALRDHLRVPKVAAALTLDRMSADELRPLLDIMLAVPGEQTALARLALFEKVEVPADTLAKQLPSLAKNLPADRLDAFAALARKKLVGTEAQAIALQNVLEALAQRGAQPTALMREWGGEVAAALLSTKADGAGWTVTALDGVPAGANPWGFQERICADGQNAQVMSSIVHGEQLTGVLRSAPFPLPDKLRFYLCGHDGFPGQPAGRKNFVRLLDATDGRMLREAAPPRNDIAQRIEWDLSEFKGRTGRIEVTDGDTAPAYAWLAIGRFKPELPQLALNEPGSASSRAALAADLARSLRLTALAAQLAAHFDDRKNGAESRAAAARAVIAFRSDDANGQVSNLPHFAAALASADEPDALREKLATYLGEVKSPSVCQLVADALPSVPFKLQQAFASALSANRCGALALMMAIENGKGSPAVLRDKATVDRLRAVAKGDELTRLDVLLKKLPPANEAADKLVAARRAAFHPAQASAVRGADVYTRHCAVCHTLEGKGGMVGPQLDGIGGRGPDRLLEDILDPNRNVDRAFRMTMITLKNGTVASGLFRREEGTQLVLADLTAQEVRVATADIATRQETETSLMAPTFGDLLPVAELNDLLAFLLSKRPEK